MKIALLVDNPRRDLPGLVLVATELARQGATCHLVPMNLRHQELWPLAPDLVLLNYLRTTNERLAGDLLEAGIQVAVLDTEGGVLASMDAYEKTLAREKSVRDRVACFCSWGPRLAAEASERGWFGKDQVCVTGAPRLDFYAPRWREAVLRSSPHADRFRQPIVLINGNFPIYNPKFKSPEDEAKSIVDQFGYAPEKVAEWQSVQRQTLRGLIELAHGLSDRFPEATFVYRPHPFEGKAIYEEQLGRDRDNLFLEDAGTVDGWILRSSAVIQRSCSTAIESGLAGVPALSPAWLPTPEVMEAAESVSTAVDSPEELGDCVAACLDGKFAIPRRIALNLDEVIKDWFYRIDGMAYKRVASALLDVAGPSGGGVLDRCRARAIHLNPPRVGLRKRARRAVRAVIASAGGGRKPSGGNNSVLARWDGSEKRFDAAEVSRHIAALAPSFSEGPPSDGARFTIVPTAQSGDYHFDYQDGRSVTVTLGQ